MLKRPNKKEIAWKAKFHIAKKKRDPNENTAAISAVIATVAAATTTTAATAAVTQNQPRNNTLRKGRKINAQRKYKEKMVKYLLKKIKKFCVEQCWSNTLNTEKRERVKTRERKNRRKKTEATTQKRELNRKRPTRK